MPVRDPPPPPKPPKDTVAFRLYQIIFTPLRLVTVTGRKMSMGALQRDAQLGKGHVWLILNRPQKGITLQTARAISYAAQVSLRWLLLGTGHPDNTDDIEREPPRRPKKKRKRSKPVKASLAAPPTPE